MDFTAIWFLLVISIVGYLIVGMIVGHIVVNLAHNDGAPLKDAQMFGGISVAAWPLAIVVGLCAAFWFKVLVPILTPKAHKEKLRQEKAELAAKGAEPVGVYMD